MNVIVAAVREPNDLLSKALDRLRFDPVYVVHRVQYAGPVEQARGRIPADESLNDGGDT